jgi:hypothetical protein
MVGSTLVILLSDMQNAHSVDYCMQHVRMLSDMQNAQSVDYGMQNVPHQTQSP